MEKERKSEAEIKYSWGYSGKRRRVEGNVAIFVGEKKGRSRADSQMVTSQTGEITRKKKRTKKKHRIEKPKKKKKYVGQ